MKINEILAEAKSAHPQQAATAIAMKKAGKKPKAILAHRARKRAKFALRWLLYR